MKKVLIYTFWGFGNYCFRFLNSTYFTNPDFEVSKYYIRGRGEKPVKYLLNYILKNDFDVILGLGNYRKDAKQIRFEKVFQNKYGKRKILENAMENYFSNLEISGFQNFDLKISEKPSVGACNRSGFLVLDLIIKNNLKAKFGFLHVPRGFEFGRTKNIINKILELK